MSITRICPWDSRLSIQISIPLAATTFLYASPRWPMGWFDFFPSVDVLFLYYDEDVHEDLTEKVYLLHRENRTVYAVLSPKPAGNATLLDLYYDRDARSNFTSQLVDAVSNLSDLGVDGFVLGDEWPRGCAREAVTAMEIAPYNSTYFAETGRWIRPDGGSRVEKAQLAGWFYERSIQVWNDLARALRSSFPSTTLGTNVDLFWKPDYQSEDLCMWKSGSWAAELDLGPYDFVVSHYYTAMPRTSKADDVDDSSLRILGSCVDRMLALTSRQGKALYVMLAAHYNEPRAITPAQMLAEFNLLAERNVSAIGWFAFDSWETGLTTRWRENSYVGYQPTYQYPVEPVYIPFHVERALLIRTLSNARREALLEDRLLRLASSCDATQPMEASYLKLDDERFVSASFSPTGKWLLVVTETRIQIRNATHPSILLREIRARGGLFVSADWAPDEAHLAYATTDGELGIADTSIAQGRVGPPEGTGERRWRLDLGRLGRLAWSTDGRLVACEANGGILLLDSFDQHANEPRTRWLINPGNGEHNLWGWSHGSGYLAVSSATSVEVWEAPDLAAATMLRKLEVGSMPVLASWSPQGDLIAVATNELNQGDLVVFDIAAGGASLWKLHMGRLPRGSRGVVLDLPVTARNVSLTPGSSTSSLPLNITFTRNVGAGAYGIWAWRTEPDGTLVWLEEPGWPRITALAWDAQGSRIAAGIEDGYMFGMDLGTGTVAPTLLRTSTPLARTTRSADAVGWLPAALPPSIWQRSSFDLVSISMLPVLSLSFSPTDPDILVACHQDGISRVDWPRTASRTAGSATKRVVLSASAASSEVSISDVGVLADARAIDWIEPSRVLAAAFGQPEACVRLWKIERDGSSNLILSLWDDDGPRDLAFSPDGQALAFSTDAGKIKLCDLLRGEIITLYEIPSGSGSTLSSLEWSPDGRWLSFTSSHAQGAASLFDLRSLELTPLTHEKAFCTAWTADGRLLAIGSSQGISLWSMGEFGPTPLSLHCTTGAVRCLFWSPDGRYLAAALETEREGLTQMKLLTWTGDELLPVAERMVAYAWEDDQYHRLFAWSPDSLRVAGAFGIAGQNDPWRVEWVKKVQMGSVCVDCLEFWFEELRPGIFLWDILSLESNVRSFPTLTDAVTSLRWLGEVGLLATASTDGKVLLWDVSPAQVGEIQAWSVGTLLALGCLILSARRMPR